MEVDIGQEWHMKPKRSKFVIIYKKRRIYRNKDIVEYSKIGTN